ncbi:hypothetical protein [Pelagibaculum spongiae]|nr:hypothetical protein [Pelagibaculum spongiae]
MTDTNQNIPISLDYGKRQSGVVLYKGFAVRADSRSEGEIFQIGFEEHISRHSVEGRPYPLSYYYGYKTTGYGISTSKGLHILGTGHPYLYADKHYIVDLRDHSFAIDLLASAEEMARDLPSFCSKIQEVNVVGCISNDHVVGVVRHIQKGMLGIDLNVNYKADFLKKIIEYEKKVGEAEVMI